MDLVWAVPLFSSVILSIEEGRGKKKRKKKVPFFFLKREGEKKGEKRKGKREVSPPMLL